MEYMKKQFFNWLTVKKIREILCNNPVESEHGFSCQAVWSTKFQ